MDVRFYPAAAGDPASLDFAQCLGYYGYSKVTGPGRGAGGRGPPPHPGRAPRSGSPPAALFFGLFPPLFTPLALSLRLCPALPASVSAPIPRRFLSPSRRSPQPLRSLPPPRQTLLCCTKEAKRDRGLKEGLPCDCLLLLLVNTIAAPLE